MPLWNGGIDQKSPAEARRACSAYGSASTTTQHVLVPPLRRSGRSGARGASIYLKREPDAATSASDGAADVNLSSSSSLYAQLCGREWTVEATDILLLGHSGRDKRGGHRRGGGRIAPGVDTKWGGLWRRAVYGLLSVGRRCCLCFQKAHCGSLLQFRTAGLRAFISSARTSASRSVSATSAY